MKRKNPKRYKLLEYYLQKIFDAGHHSYFKITLELSHEELIDFYDGKAPNLAQLEKSGRAEFEKRYDWDDAIGSMGRSNTARLITRDIKIFWAIEKIKTNKSISIEKAVFCLIDEWPSNFGPPLGEDTVIEIYKNYVHFLRPPQKIPIRDNESGKIISWEKEDDPMNFSWQEEAAYTLREMKVRTGQYPINKPTGIFEEIHRILELPFEEDIERELGLYHTIRNRAFGVTFIHPLRLVNQSMGDFINRYEKRSEKIRNAIRYVSEKYDYDFNKLLMIYYHYRLIEAGDNGQDRRKIFKKLQEDLKNIS
jgi:hypothetical protein